MLYSVQTVLVQTVMVLHVEGLCAALVCLSRERSALHSTGPSSLQLLLHAMLHMSQRVELPCVWHSANAALFRPSRYHPEGPCTAVPQPNVFHFKLVMAFWILLLGFLQSSCSVVCSNMRGHARQ